ncbi:hypothetical protein [Streptomyces sp. PRh5]|uniref:hypothetical protein n=1 Tax=Streptomyces sp. PRh5 TaxID=1158056 RepID=UPI0018E2C3B1|nr:hypothetical protein [Streptomyces sp. PRh5]
MLAELVPVGGGGDDEQGDVEEHREAGPAFGDGCGAQGADGAAQGSGLVLLGANAGAGGVFEGERGLLELALAGEVDEVIDAEHAAGQRKRALTVGWCASRSTRH